MASTSRKLKALPNFGHPYVAAHSRSVCPLKNIKKAVEEKYFNRSQYYKWQGVDINCNPAYSSAL